MSSLRLLPFILLCAMLATRADSQVDDPEAEAGDSAASLEEQAFDLLFGRGVERDTAEAAKLFEEAAGAGRPNAKHALALLLRSGDGVPPDEARALELSREAAEQGIAAAQSFLGWAYATGAGVEPDMGEALRWLVAAARQEDAYSTNMLSGMLRSGQGVDRDLELSLALATRSAELGNNDARRDIALWALYGDPEQRDEDKGLFFLEKAALAGDSASAFGLGSLYLEGTIIDRNYDAAAMWLKIAADAKHNLAALWLAELYANGRGVERDDAYAEEIRRTALEAAELREKNAFAWQLSVAPDVELRNGELAVSIMEAEMAVPESRSYWALDTLAAAYAESGHFEKAIATQSEAIDALSESSPSQQLIRQLEDRLALYRAGQPYRADAN